MKPKEPNLVQIDEKSSIVTGVVSKHKLPSISKKWFFLAGGILFAAAIAVAGTLLFHSKPKSKPVPKNTAFTINNRNYSKAEVQKLIIFPTGRGIDAKKASQQAFDYLKKQEIAKKLAIEPSEQQIAAAEKTLFQISIDNKLLAPDPWVRMAAYDLALSSLINQNAETGKAQGYSYIFRFGEHLEKGPDFTPPGYKDSQLIAQDRSYAQDRANYYSRALKTKSISPDQALAEIKKDPKLGYSNKSGTNLSIHFGISDKSWREDVFYKPVFDFINTEAKQGLNDIKVGKTLTVPGSKLDSDYAETFLYFVLLDKVPTGNLKNKFNEELNKLPARYYGI